MKTTQTAPPIAPNESPLAVVGWVIVVLLLIVAALGVLALLPPMG